MVWRKRLTIIINQQNEMESQRELLVLMLSLLQWCDMKTRFGNEAVATEEL